ncbi:hypothetical protein BO94DRAFT_534906 [Aspergillus sclerotioniger CBS 115572]|uniref:Uncharacterized protein n=1 Tax=Aspergillus sclerotioniger CBS 115572 TaxID=1450535 RepID=A0A317WPF7_9EURO|nr:hypothetical protein BO94DRAFT_534906 [Aspergillus sclerotioniger CBS 115572]PWY87905.1 hypothetical protein BO94DRAFT_534906 [Aspergillus sclerotioniger CBS 115572]
MGNPPPVTHLSNFQESKATITRQTFNNGQDSDPADATTFHLPPSTFHPHPFIHSSI